MSTVPMLAVVKRPLPAMRTDAHGRAARPGYSNRTNIMHAHFFANGRSHAEGKATPMTKKANAAPGASKRSRIPARRFTLPLAWWRTMTAETFDATTAVVLREAISAIAIIGEPMWRAAANGDAAAATGLALRLHPDRATPIAFDLVMTAVAACAAEGNAAACLVMSRMVRRRRGAGKKEARIATSWLVRTFASALDRPHDGGTS